ncbi:MAG: hypothetical protein Q4D96_14275 [Propionibacteriaceae bacterium]|nr:hypothetical protein [Propionibacteriaceae bacterium]
MVVSGTQLGQWSGHGTPGWVGEAADAHMSSITTLRSKLFPIRDGLTAAALKAESWAEALEDVIELKIPDLHDAWDQVQRIVDEENRKAAQAQCRPGELPQPSAPSRSGELDMWAHQRRTEILEDYKRVISKLNEVAQDAAAGVKAARSLFLPEDVGTDRNEISEHMFQDDDSILEAQTRWERGQDIAKEITQRLDEGFENKEQLREFLDEYGDDLENPIVATALGQEMTPEQLTDEVLENLWYIHDPELCRELVSKMGTFQVLAGGGVNLSPEQAENQELLLKFQDALPETRVGDLSAHEAFAEKLLEAGRRDVSVPWAPHTKLKGTELIAQLVGQAGLDNPHLALGEPVLRTDDEKDSFLKDLLRHDSRVLRNIDGDERRSYGRLILPWLDPKLEDPVFALTTLMDQSEGAATHDSEAMRRHEADRMAGLKSFLGSKITGVDTNGDGVIDGKDQEINITEYIMGGRTVNERKVMMDGSWQSYSGFPDGGVQFATVVAEASRPESDDLFDVMSPEEQEAWRKRDAQAARIARGYLLGYQNGLEVYRPAGVKEIEGQLPFGYENRASRSLAADVIGPHLKGVSRSMATFVLDEQDLFYDESSGRHLIALAEGATDRLRGSEGVFADLAFDGTAEYSKAAKGMPLGKVPSIENPSAVDKLLAWVATGYRDDLRATFEVTNVPRSDDPRSKVVESTADWVHITNTLFSAPDGASGLQAEAVRDRNEVWRHRAEDGVVMLKAAAGLAKNPAVGAAAEVVDHMVVQPSLDDAFPTDFQRHNVHESKLSVTEKFMLATMTTVAAEEVDFSQAPVPLSKLRKAAGEEFKVLDEEGNLLPLESMASNARGRFLNYLTRELVGWEFEEAREVMRLEGTIADLEQQEQLRHEDIQDGKGLEAQELERRKKQEEEQEG